MARTPQLRTGASQVPPLTFHLSCDRGLHLSFQGVVTQGEVRVSALPHVKNEKCESNEHPVPQFPKFTFQFKTNNNTLCLVWMSAAAKGRRYVLFLHQWKSSFIFWWRAHTVWGQPRLHCTGMPEWTAHASQCCYKSQELHTQMHTHRLTHTHRCTHAQIETLMSRSALNW